MNVRPPGAPTVRLHIKRLSVEGTPSDGARVAAGLRDHAPHLIAARLGTAAGGTGKEFRQGGAVESIADQVARELVRRAEPSMPPDWKVHR